MRPTKIQLQSNVELRPLSFDPFIKSKNDANETFVSRKNVNTNSKNFENFKFIFFFLRTL